MDGFLGWEGVAAHVDMDGGVVRVTCRDNERCCFFFSVGSLTYLARRILFDLTLHNSPWTSVLSPYNKMLRHRFVPVEKMYSSLLIAPQWMDDRPVSSETIYAHRKPTTKGRLNRCKVESIRGN
jgi:hypothetical protein